MHFVRCSWSSVWGVLPYLCVAGGGGRWCFVVFLVDQKKLTEFAVNSRDFSVCNCFVGLPVSVSMSVSVFCTWCVILDRLVIGMDLSNRLWWSMSSRKCRGSPVEVVVMGNMESHLMSWYGFMVTFRPGRGIGVMFYGVDTLSIPGGLLGFLRWPRALRRGFIYQCLQRAWPGAIKC